MPKLIPHSAAIAHQDRLLARADRSADIAERAVRRIWLRLLKIIKDGGAHFIVYQASLAALRSLPSIATDVLDELTATAQDAAKWTAERLVHDLPARVVRDRFEDDTFDPLVELIMPSLTRQQVHAVVYAAGWTDRIRSLTRLAEPEVLAARIAHGVQSGQTVAKIAADIRPLVQGVQTSARRVARTAGLWVAHEAELHTYEQLKDIIEGYQVHAVLDHATRPEHRARDGTKYYREPDGGQLGFDAMPRPPRESPKDGGGWAFNCRCWLEPILRD